MIERWHPADDAAELHKIYTAAQLADNPTDFPFSPTLFRAWLARGWMDEPREVWSAPGTGWYRLLLPDRENSGRCLLDLCVAPAERRHGAGTELLRHAMGRAAANGRSLLRGYAWEGSPGEAFALARGGRLDHTEIRRVQDVASAPRGAPIADGYSIVTWTGSAPEDLIGQLAALRSAMEDAPHAEGHENTVWDVARVRDGEDLKETFGTREYSAAVRHDATASLVALTQVAVDPMYPDWGFQEITVVLRAHRGHGLGLAVKSAMLDLLDAAEPGLRRIVTFNGETNKHMIAVNEALGYRIDGPAENWYRMSVVEA